jgi:hypothetical protein
MTLIVADRVKETTSTVGTGTYTLSGAKTGFRAFSSVMANLDTCYYVCTDGTGWETGLGTLSSGKLQRTVVYGSSNFGAAVNWSAGTRDIFIAFPAQGLLFSANNLSEVSAAHVSVLQNLKVLPAGQGGGSNGQVVRLSSANTWAAASKADTVDQLVGLMFRSGGGYWPPGSIVPLGGLTAGAVYYLDTGGGVTTSPPTPTDSVRRVVIGKAISTTQLLFWPGTPVTG